MSNNLPNNKRQLLLRYLAPQRSRVMTLSALILLSLALQLANPQLIRYFLDSIQTGGTLQQLLGAASIFMSVTIVAQAIRLTATYFSEMLGWTATNWLRVDLARHCLGLDMSFHKVHTPGELIERVDGDINELADFFSHLILTMISNGLLFIGVIVLLWIEGWQLGVMMVILSLISYLIINLLRSYITPRWERLREAEAGLFGFLEERLGGTEDIQTSGAKGYTMLRLAQHLLERWQAAHHAVKVDAWLISMPIWIFGMAYAGAHLVTGTLFSNGVLTIGSIYLVFHYIGMVEGPLWQTMDMVDKFQRAVASINRIAQLFQIQPTLQDGPGAELPSGPLAVSFNQVSFQYDDALEERLRQQKEKSLSGEHVMDHSEGNSSESYHSNGYSSADDRSEADDGKGSGHVLDRPEVIIQNVSFRLEPGQILGLLGRTGSGKSTLSKLLFRFYDPTEGEICIGNAGLMVDLRDTKRTDLRGRIGMVTQDVQLFHTNVRNNLTLFDSSVNDEQIMAILAEVGLLEWLKALPDGLDTHLSGNNANLSAGEAQLLAFTRVFLADPGLVILDEASSRLDPATEQRIEAALNRLLQDRSGIIIAHRLATVQRADQILILDKGGVGEYGPRAELATDPNSRFYRLLQAGALVADEAL